MSDDTNAAPKLGVSDIVAVAAGASTLVTTVGALAVTGALQQMQRNHGVTLMIAFGLVLLASAIWVALTLSKPSPPAKPAAQAASGSTAAPESKLVDLLASVEERLFPNIEKVEALQAALATTIGRAEDVLERAEGVERRRPAGPLARLWAATSRHRRGLAEIAALGLFLGGILTGLVGMVITQQAQERPSVTASVDRNTLLLTVTATAHNLGTEDRMITEVDGLTRSQRPDGTFAFKEDVRYLTLTGPDAGGTATQTFTYTIPFGYVAVSVSATTGDQTSCRWEETLARRQSAQPRAPVRGVKVAPKQHTLPGCVLIYLPATTA